jgi:hypothetical protein
MLAECYKFYRRDTQGLFFNYPRRRSPTYEAISVIDSLSIVDRVAPPRLVYLRLVGEVFPDGLRPDVSVKTNILMDFLYKKEKIQWVLP